MIIATAGHVDHGKTALIRQLTGVETDRLEEEQRRGLSINLGYAYLPHTGGTPLGFIDVPGHHRFINTMISGISGIDTGMLVIAADDGPMPQTHEHMDVLQLLGIKHLVVVISKIDRVAPEQVEAVNSTIEALLATRPWKNTPIFPISNTDGSGIESLKTHLIKCHQEHTARSVTGYFRLSIDRAFIAKGAGLVVTGTVAAGSVSLGETLKLIPRGVDVRVRGIRVHDQKADAAVAGQRCALNLAGKLDAASIARGDWLVQPGVAPPGNRLDVDCFLLASAAFPLKHLSPIKMYIGARRVAGRIALLNASSESKRLQPGANCLAQLILEDEVACFRGERFVLRDHAENVILGGGTILDPQGPRSGKSKPERIASLHAMKAGSPADVLAELIAQGQVINLEQFRQSCNLRLDETQQWSLSDTRSFEAEGSDWAVSSTRWTQADKLLLAYLDKWHQREPQLSGIKVTELKSALIAECELPLLMAVLSTRLRSGDLIIGEGRISRLGFKPKVSMQSKVQWEQLQKELLSRASRIPLLSEVSAQTGLTIQELEVVAKAAVKNGWLHGISGQRYALPEHLYTLAADLLSLANSGEDITVVAAKNRFNIGRNLTVEILEFFDRIRYTRRNGNTRVILDPELPVRLFKG